MGSFVDAGHTKTEHRVSDGCALRMDIIAKCKCFDCIVCVCLLIFAFVCSFLCVSHIE